MTTTGVPSVPEGPVAAAVGIARRFRIFSSPVGAPRYRRGTDILLLVPCLLGLVLVVAAYLPGRSERVLAGWLDSIPSWIDPPGQSPPRCCSPSPGGIGVTEPGLTVGLASAGMSEEAALAAALLYRISVFYVPPVWGFFALRWLQQKQYL